MNLCIRNCEQYLVEEYVYKNEILIYTENNNKNNLPLVRSFLLNLLHKLHAHLQSFWNNPVAVKKL
jgi:hypothetical protein